jgi:NTE family protein
MRENGSGMARPRIGLVLGAGGIRGAAHAAVITTLGEAGVPIDLVVGASVGALYGLPLAAGIPAREIARRAVEASPRDLLRFYLGRLRPGRANPIARLLLDAGEGRTFADLAIPFAVTVTDVLAGTPSAIQHGPVLPAVQASIAIPFVAKPVEIEGRLYADGGMLDTLPIPIARVMGADRVIGVCLGINYMAPDILRKRPWTRDALARLGRQERMSRLPLLDHTRFYARLCAESFDPLLPCNEADVTITPEFGRIGPNSMVGSAFCFEQGIRAAREALPRILALLNQEEHALA